MRTTTAQTLDVSRPMRLALIVGVVASVIAVIGLFISGAALFFQAYLYSFLFWLGISLGGMVLLFLHFTVSSRWGLTIRRVLEAAGGSIWAMAILFIPILFGLPYLFPWADPAKLAASDVLQYRTWYLNVPFFIARAVIYFVIWIGMVSWINRRSAAIAHEPGGDATIRGRLHGIGAFFMVVYGVTMTFAAVDWLMSLDSTWTSTAFGVVIMMSQVLTALSFAILVLNLIPSLSLGRTWNYLTTPVPFRDLGALMITFVMAFAYVAYFQMLIQWAGNIPHEVHWYIDRLAGGWNIVAIFFSLFGFAIPFAVLLTRRIRHSLRTLAILGAILLFTFLVMMFWHVKPAFFPGQFSVSWLDIVMPFALGGLWIAAFLFVLNRRPALPVTDEELIVVPGNVEQPVPYVKGVNE